MSKQGWRDSKRAEWKGYDPRFMTAINMIKDGVFGDKEYFQVTPCCFCACKQELQSPAKCPCCCSGSLLPAEIPVTCAEPCLLRAPSFDWYDSQYLCVYKQMTGGDGWPRLSALGDCNLKVYCRPGRALMTLSAQ